MGIGRLRVIEHPVGEAGLDNSALFHDDHPMGEQPRYRQIMGDDDGRKAQNSATSPRNRSSKARLYRDIKAPGGLIHEDKARSGDQISSDLEPLAHAAGEGAGLVVNAVGGDFHLFEPVAGGLSDITIMALADGHQPLAHIGPGGDAHAQAIGRILMNKAPIGAHQEAFFCLVHGQGRRARTPSRMR